MGLEEGKPNWASADPSVAYGHERKPVINAVSTVSMTHMSKGFYTEVMYACALDMS